MSAICAILQLDRAPVAPSAIDALLDAIPEYGPVRATWKGAAGSPAALGVRPWPVTPEDASYRAPVVSRDGQVALVADVRLDNRAELAAALSMPDEARHACDAEYVLAAYERWGRACPRRLVGDFAFIVWDGRTRRLLAVRDAIGQRVLFLRRDATRLALATTAHALAVEGRTPPRLNRQKVADFLVLVQRPESTFFEGIDRLPPGHLLEVDGSSVRTERWWSPWNVPPLQLGSDEAYVEGFREVFRAAVQAQLRAEGDVGMLLSGGLDSSSVAATAAALLGAEGRRLRAFHAAPREGFLGEVAAGMVADESRDVQALAAQYSNIELQVHRSDGRSPFDGVETSFRYTGVPVRNASNVAWYDGLCAQAGASGVRVLLSGHKGNGTISYAGVRGLRDDLARLRLSRVVHEVSALARAGRTGRREVFRDEVLLPLLPPAVATALDRWNGRAAPSLLDLTVSPINPLFATAMDVEQRARATHRDFAGARHLGALAQRVTMLVGGTDTFDAYSGYRARYGVETRDPTADRRVVEFCFGIPAAQYLRDGVDRWLVRRAMEGVLPDQIRTRRTIGGQGADWTEWLPALRPWIVEELERLEQHETTRECLDLPRMRSLVEHWPSPLRRTHFRMYNLLLLRGMMMGCFIRWYERTYG
ncbi:MAG: asparagine synthase-related protein [Gemmatimonadaceae bacterium]